MGAREDDPEPYRPTANSSSSSGQRAQDAVVLECEQPQEVKAVFDLEMQSMSVEKQPDSVSA